jgi:hypothetical protein
MSETLTRKRLAIARSAKPFKVGSAKLEGARMLFGKSDSIPNATPVFQKPGR